jgi:hypothetical protein
MSSPTNLRLPLVFQNLHTVALRNLRLRCLKHPTTNQQLKTSPNVKLLSPSKLSMPNLTKNTAFEGIYLFPERFGSSFRQNWHVSITLNEVS